MKISTRKVLLIFYHLVLRFDTVWWYFNHLWTLLFLLRFICVCFAIVVNQGLNACYCRSCWVDGLVQTFTICLYNSINFHKVKRLLNLLINVEGEEGGWSECEKEQIGDSFHNGIGSHEGCKSIIIKNKGGIESKITWQKIDSWWEES